jgi:thiamine-phosphate pyrophosphorylase
MKLIVITPSRKHEHEITAIVSMFNAGLQTLHVRKNKLSTYELEEYLKEIPEKFHNRIVIHSHHKLALKYNLKGFHFTSTHLKKRLKLWWNTKMIYLRKPYLTKSISYKRMHEIQFEEKVKTDYCFLGTMFNNISGELYSGFYKETILNATQKQNKKIIARGGINTKSIELAHQLGFYGVSLYGNLWKSTHPFDKYMEFINYCKEKNILLD